MRPDAHVDPIGTLPTMRVRLSVRGGARAWVDSETRARLRSAAVAMLQAACREAGRRAELELSLSLVDDGEMRRLNLAYRGLDRTTDVLSFAQREGEGGACTSLLGDVVISAETAKRHARSGDLQRELRRLLAHGLAHLLGHDHRTPAEARSMRAHERALMRAASPARQQAVSRRTRGR